MRAQGSPNARLRSNDGALFISCSLRQFELDSPIWAFFSVRSMVARRVKIVIVKFVRFYVWRCVGIGDVCRIVASSE